MQLTKQLNYEKCCCIIHGLITKFVIEIVELQISVYDNIKEQLLQFMINTLRNLSQFKKTKVSEL